MSLSLLVEVFIRSNDRALAQVVEENVRGRIDVFHVRTWDDAPPAAMSITMRIEIGLAYQERADGDTERAIASELIRALRAAGYRKDVDVRALDLDRAGWIVREELAPLRLVAS